MYQNLKGTSRRYQRQIENDAMLEQWEGVKIASAALGTTPHAVAIAESMQERVTLAMWQIDNWDWVCEIEKQDADHADLMDTQAGAIF